MKHVFVGMSGGVDSSVTAALLKQQGYKVTGVFMKNWAQDLPGFKCPWREDLTDAKHVAVQLGIDFKLFDFQNEYKHKVVDYMIDEYKAGRTPNPDIICNQEVKFKLFLETALEQGADLIATGHYAKINRQDGAYLLKTAKDESKDQTYFLYRMDQKALSHTLFPLGRLLKDEVRNQAKQLGLVTAEKKDSVGICFVGEIGIKEFLKNFVDTKQGPTIDEANGKPVGQHDGALFYTIGQRHGLGVGGGLPYYVVGKDMAKNEVYVTSKLHNPKLWRQSVELINCHWINQPPESAKSYLARFRHRGPLVLATINYQDATRCTVNFHEEVKALADGQSVVVYDQDIVLGGGIVSTI